MPELNSWKKIPIGCKTIDAGSSIQYKTGSWRNFKPILDMKKCNKCMICFVFCPDSCINPETYGIDYEHCKGCGICSHECPLKAIQMVEDVI